MVRLRALSAAFVLFVSFAVQARVISYAPYTDRTAYPAHQSRTNRHFVLLEVTPPSQFGVLPAATYGQLVVYDSTGAEEPRVVFPTDGSSKVFTAAAARETSDGALQIFAQTTEPGFSVFNSYMSVDGGATWKEIALPGKLPVAQLGSTGADNGGPFASYRYSQVRIGTAEFPFVVSTVDAVYSISAEGSVKKLFQNAATPSPITRLAGRDRNGTRFLVAANSDLLMLDLNGSSKVVRHALSTPAPSFEGFITDDGAAYFDERSNAGDLSTGALYYVSSGGQEAQLFPIRWTEMTSASVFAVPTADYSGAWIIQRGGGHPTSLYLHKAGVMATQWEDITSPDVEALHAGASGNKLLIQVHRPRPAVDQRIFKDPALAVWRVGQAAPRVYDELFMNEQWNKGFVHVDVEKIESGEPFVFDAGAAPTGGGGGIIVSPPTSGGGSDVLQEWGVVRASLKQQLVFPTVGRTKGAFGSDWVSDVIIQNPSDEAQTIALRYVPNGDGVNPAATRDATLTLAGNEIRLIRDVVNTLFQIESGIGALFMTPQSTITATSRTYSRAPQGTFGFGMNAVDVMAAAASPRFPLSFAGAFLGNNYRTNVTVTDTSGHGTEVVFSAVGNSGTMGYDISTSTGANGHQQMNFVGSALGIQPYETGALVLRPKRGNAIAAVFAVDNRTNDSTYFPPDLPSAFFARTIPAIGHLDGANASRFRSDLYLYNPSDQPRSVTLEAKLWDASANPAFLTLTLLPNEARVIRDVLPTAFGLTGIARLRFTAQQGNQTPGVRVTSRTYSVDDNGGTYGFLMPPLNNFQIAGPADTLEILGAVADPGYRTNIGLVEVTQWGPSGTASAKIEIFDSASKSVDSFTANFPIGGGTQLNDVFRARGLTVSGPVLIRITPTNGTIGAYATTTDNGTNDSSYLAANLAAKQ